MATSRKTLQLDLLQLNALNFKTLSNTNIPSSFVLYANGNGTTSFGSISSLTEISYNKLSVPGQSTLIASTTSGVLNLSSITNDIYISTNTTNSLVWFGLPNLTTTILSTQTSTLNSVLPSTCIGIDNNLLIAIANVNTNINENIIPNLGSLGYVSTSQLVSTVNHIGNLGYISSSQLQSTMYNILTYPNICSSIKYHGNTGLTNFSTLNNSGTASFSSLQYSLNNFTKYMNPNGSSRVFIDYAPSFTFSEVATPSDIASINIYPEGSPYIKNLLSLSSHFVYYSSQTTNVNETFPLLNSGIQQYIPVTSSVPYGLSTNTRALSNTFIQHMTLEIDSLMISTLNLNEIGLIHYISDSIVYKDLDDVIQSGLERTSVQINTSLGDNSVFIRIANSGNQF